MLQSELQGWCLCLNTIIKRQDTFFFLESTREIILSRSNPSVVSFSHFQKWHRPTFLHHSCPWSCFYSYWGFLFQCAISFSQSSQCSKCRSWLSIPSANTDSYPISEINATVSFIDQVNPVVDSSFLHLSSHPSPRSVTGLHNVPQNYNQSPSSQPSSLTSPFFSIGSYSNPLDAFSHPIPAPFGTHYHQRTKMF